MCLRGSNKAILFKQANDRCSCRCILRLGSSLPQVGAEGSAECASMPLSNVGALSGLPAEQQSDCVPGLLANGHMPTCLMQDAAQLLHEAADETNNWESRMRCLSELSYALECEEGKYEVGALAGNTPDAY